MIKNTLMLAMIFTLMCTSVTYAHPPSDIKISFNANTNMLKAVIYHNVSNPSKHYIKKVDVVLNGEEILSQSINREDNNLTQTVTYLIPGVNAGDVLSVEAYCSLSGKLIKSITVK